MQPTLPADAALGIDHAANARSRYIGRRLVDVVGTISERAYRRRALLSLVTRFLHASVRQMRLLPAFPTHAQAVRRER
jgi:hypothetical protein